MSGWLLDTNVISELRKPRCDHNVKLWSERHLATSYFVSRITLAEIRFGIEQVTKDKDFRFDLEQWLENTLRPWFANRILEIDEEIILTWRRMIERGKIRHHTFSQPDLFIAATASVYDLCIVTRNIHNFIAAEVKVLNPWTDDEPRIG